MTSRRTPARTAGALALAACAVTLTCAPVEAAASPAGTDSWGTVLQTDSPVQADAWSVRISGRSGLLVSGDTRAHFPAFDGAPSGHDDRDKEARLSYKAQPIGVLDEPYTSTEATGAKKDGVRAETTFHSIDLASPYRPGPQGAAPHGDVGIALDKVRVVADSTPGHTVRFTTSVASGTVYAGGKAVHRLDGKKWRPNTGLRFPSAENVPPVLVATVNEQITTDDQGHPTTDATGSSYRFDPSATSGYANALHMTVLSPEVADFTIGHAAVLRRPDAAG
ncbi:hypothetical protein ACIBUY_03255 [Streptomyces sp. NPDC050085]|uniref:hypothetical protein n=1 Tax=Streptomyces sp. NPDC050085 TaxID=3365600 RepID=UPI0037A4DB17